MTRRTIFVCLLAGALLLPYFLRAEQTRYWRQTDRSEFEKGTAKGVAIRSDGKLMPAPKFEQFADPNLAYLWEMRMDSHGHLFAAGGADAKVLRFDSAGKPTTVFESSELAAQAIAFDSEGQSVRGHFSGREGLQSHPGRTEKRLLRPEDEIYLGARGGFARFAVCGHRRPRRNLRRRSRRQGSALLPERREARANAGIRRQRKPAGRNRAERTDSARRNSAKGWRHHTCGRRFVRDLRNEQGRSDFPARGFQGEFVCRFGRRKGARSRSSPRRSWRTASARTARGWRRPSVWSFCKGNR